MLTLLVCYHRLSLAQAHIKAHIKLRAGVALAPLLTCAWGLTKDDQGICPKCSAHVTTSDAQHLLWMCPGMQGIRLQNLRKSGLKPDLPEYNDHLQRHCCSSCTMQSWKLLFNFLLFLMPPCGKSSPIKKKKSCQSDPAPQPGTELDSPSVPPLYIQELRGLYSGTKLY